MNNFLEKFREYYDNLFPIITDENIVRRTFVFYVLLYLTIFSACFSIGVVSVSNLAITIVLFLFLGLTGSNFVVSHKFPNPLHIIRLFHGFNLFMLFFILFFGFILLFGSFLFAFNINLTDFKYANIIILGIVLGLLIFSFVTLFYYLKNGAVGIFKFISKKNNKKM